MQLTGLINHGEAVKIWANAYIQKGLLGKIIMLKTIQILLKWFWNYIKLCNMLKVEIFGVLNISVCFIT